MIEDVSFTIHKSPSIAAPFRRQLFEPYDHIIYNPISHQPLRPKDNSLYNQPQEPTAIIGEDGAKLYRLSDIKKQIEEAAKAKEEEIRKRFIKDLNDEIMINVQRQEQNNASDGNDHPKEDDSTNDIDSINMYF